MIFDCSNKCIELKNHLKTRIQVSVIPLKNNAPVLKSIILEGLAAGEGKLKNWGETGTYKMNSFGIFSLSVNTGAFGFH